MEFYEGSRWAVKDRGKTGKIVRETSLAGDGSVELGERFTLPRSRVGDPVANGICLRFRSTDCWTATG